MVFCFDLDGVILKFPFYKQIKIFDFDYFLSQKLMRKSRFWRMVFYRFVRINSRVVEYLSFLAIEQNRLVIISAQYREYQKEMSDFLRKENIPFDAIYLWDRRKTVCEFKQEVINQEGCDFYFDDRLEIIDNLVIPGRKICYQGEEKFLFF